MELFLVILIYPLTIYFLTWWYHRLRRSMAARFAWIPLVLMVLAAVVDGYLTVMLFGGAFGIGSMMLCAAIPATIVGFMVHRSSAKAHTPDKAKVSAPRYRLTRLLVTLLILAVNLAPIIGYISITTVCFRANAALAQPLIDAITAYQRDNDIYPDDLQALIPNYLESIPEPVCLTTPSYASADYAQYHLEMCPVYDRSSNANTGERAILWLEVVQGGFPQRYNIETGRWSSISFLDGVCSFLD